MNTHKKGFTLIELLVVISIISLLSSVILSSLNSARNKAKDAAIKQTVLQYRNLLALELSDKGGYTNLTATGGVWWGNTADCSDNNAASGYTFVGSGSGYATQAQQICKQLVSSSLNTAPIVSGNTYAFFMGRPSTSSTDPLTFVLMVWLPGKGKYFCMSSTGSVSDTQDSSFGWSAPGCYNNP